MSEESSKKKPIALTQRQKKRYTKFAMGATIALLFATGFTRNRTARKMHVVAGFALVGLTAYHISLYPKNQRS